MYGVISLSRRGLLLHDMWHQTLEIKQEDGEVEQGRTGGVGSICSGFQYKEIQGCSAFQYKEKMSW